MSSSPLTNINRSAAPVFNFRGIASSARLVFTDIATQVYEKPKKKKIEDEKKEDENDNVNGERRLLLASSSAGTPLPPPPPRRLGVQTIVPADYADLFHW
jgi:hypothetical protein